jgi:Fic family protein
MDIFEKSDLNQEKINKNRPFTDKNILKELKDYYRIGLTWSSNALEGNTLTESETKVLLEDGLTIGGKPVKDAFETIGHAEAYDFMFSIINNKNITEKNIKTMHRYFYRSIEEEYAGIYRDIEVIVTGSRYPVCKPEKINEEMAKFILWVNESNNKLHPIKFAAQIHKKIVFIHPFKDGNGRISRLIMNLALIQKGYLLAVIPPVLRHEYISLLERAHKDDQPFENFICERVIESQKEISRLLHIEI